MFPTGLPSTQKKQRFAGLEAVVNTGDSLESYEALADTWPTFFPHDPNFKWWPEAHQLFLDYRDKLRKVWMRKAEAEAIDMFPYLLGLISPTKFAGEGDEGILLFRDPQVREFHRRETKATLDAWNILRKSHPQENWIVPSVIVPLWGQANCRYFPKGDFEAALWTLFSESWRAKICGQCQRYFIAEKPAQTYCSASCFRDAKRSQKLAWWAKSGRNRRTQKTLSSRKRRTRKTTR